MNPARLEIQGVPPIAVEALLDYCYKDKLVSASSNIFLRAELTVRMHEYKSSHTSIDILIFSSFCRADYENGYSRNLLWRLWHLAHLLGTQHLFQMCTEVRLISFVNPVI